MARILSAIPQVKRRAIEITARLGVDKLGPSGITREWRNARYDYVRAPAHPHTPRSSRQDPPSQTTGGRLVSTEGARRRCRSAPARRIDTTEGVSGIKKPSPRKTSSTFSRKFNQATIKSIMYQVLLQTNYGQRQRVGSS